jgi:hypothetical protein
LTLRIQTATEVLPYCLLNVSGFTLTDMVILNVLRRAAERIGLLPTI